MTRAIGCLVFLFWGVKMKTKQLTFILTLAFLFLFSGSVYGEELEVKYDGL
jgi:hypothetical protein